MDTGFGIADMTMWLSQEYEGRNFSLAPFAYPVNNLVIPASGSAQSFVPILANCDFLFLQFNYSTPDGNAPTTLPLTIMIIDTGSNEIYMQTPANINLYGATGYRTNMQPYPRIVAGRTVLQVTIANLSAGEITLSFSFEGMNIYTYG